MPETRLILGDCQDVLPTLESGSVNCVITDPPYPMIRRSYGTWTEEEWFRMMRVVVPECMRILKPTGSAVFILQPNSERVGRMRTWLWEFMLWVGKEYGIVQDAWWWNINRLPTAGANSLGMLRDSLKACVWLGSPNCYRCQANVLQDPSPRMLSRMRLNERCDISGDKVYPSGQTVDEARTCRALQRRGGVTPFNVLPIPAGYGQRTAGAYGHSAGTPLALCSWWLRYLCPPNGICLDPFSGSGTVGVAAAKQGNGYIGIERIPEYHAIAEKRIAEVNGPLFAEAKP